MGAGDLTGRGSGDVFQGIGNAQLLPFKGAQGVVGQYLYLLNVAERIEHLAQTGELLFIGGDARHQYVTNPNRFFYVGQIAGAVENRLVAVAREPTVFLAVDMLDVEQYQIGALHETLELRKEWFLTGERLGGRVETGVDATTMGFLKEIDEKVYLQ